MIRNVSFLTDGEQTVADILRENNNIDILCIREDGIEHGYIGKEDIDRIDSDILSKTVCSFLIVNHVYGLTCYIEV